MLKIVDLELHNFPISILVTRPFSKTVDSHKIKNVRSNSLAKASSRYTIALALVLQL